MWEKPPDRCFRPNSWERPLRGNDSGQDLNEEKTYIMSSSCISIYYHRVYASGERSVVIEESISTIFQEIPHITELKTVSTIIANNPFRRKFTPLHMGVNVSFLTLELALP